MARLNRRYRQQAAQQARAEVAPVIKSKRRGLRHEVEALRSEEDPLNTGLENAAATIRHSGLTGADRDRVLETIAQQQAAVPESITSQITSAREDTGGEISDLQTQEAQQRASILSSLLAKAAETQAAAHAEVAAENRQRSGDIKQAELEKALGLGSYDQTPSPEEAVQIPKIEAETDLLGKNGGLTPSEARGVHAEHVEAHDELQAAHLSARKIFEDAKAGKIKGLGADPQEWDAATYSGLIPGVVALAKKYGTTIDTATAQKAVAAIQDHVEGAQQPASVVNSPATAVAVGTLPGTPDLSALTAALAAAAHSQRRKPDPRGLLSQLPALPAGRF
jgi:hypothetical protein